MLTREQAIALLDGQLETGSPRRRRGRGPLVYVDAADAVIEDRTGPQLVWVVGAEVDPTEEDGALFDAVTGQFLSSSAGPASAQWADLPDLAPALRSSHRRGGATRRVVVRGWLVGLVPVGARLRRRVLGAGRVGWVVG